MKKKYAIFGIIGLFAIALVTAGIISNYFTHTAELDLVNPISVSGDLVFSGSLFAGASIDGSSFTIFNAGEQEVSVLIESSEEEGIEVVYWAETELTEKIVDFNVDIWEIPEEAEKVEIKYVAVGEEFEAVVENQIEGYVLIYYADKDNRFANYGQGILVEDVLGNLPGLDDANANLNDYSLEYPDTPFGAKLWYVPLSALSLNGEAYDINWGMASEFYYESELIQYNEDGEIMMYGGMDLELTPEYITDILLDDGLYEIITEVNPLVA